MSFDLNLNIVCNHLIYRELVILGTNRRDLRVSKVLAASRVSVYASNNLIPSSMYEVVTDPRTINVQQPRMIQLKNKWKSPTDFFEISYTTIKGYCPKCVGLEVLDDISYDVKGDLRIIRNEKLLLQNLEKFVVTEIGSNPFHAWMGTGLVNLLGDKILDVNFLTTRVTQEINQVLEKFKDLQEQYRLTGRTMTDGEILDSVQDINVEFDQNDPTILRADISVTARSGKSMEFSQVLQIPEG